MITKHSLLITLILLSLIGLVNCQGSNNKLTQQRIFPALKSNLPQIITFGSCSHQERDIELWKDIAKEPSDLWIWLGDIIYCDTQDSTLMKQAYSKALENEYYVDMMHKTPIIGVWDDHDYGINDGGRINPMKNVFQKMVLNFLQVPDTSYLYKQEGLYQQYVFEENGTKLQVILVDTRYFRTDLKDSPNKGERYTEIEEGTFLGEKQWNWLENSIKREAADVIILGSSIQLLANNHHFEKWGNMPKERDRLISILDKSKAQKIVVLSGDRHVSELSALETASHKMIYDFTSSGITHSYEEANETNELRVSPLIGEKNYGVIRFDWDKKPVSILLESKGLDGKVHFKKTI